MAEPLKIHYDPDTDTLRVNDTLFAAELFRKLDSLLPLRMPFVVDERKVRDDGTKVIILEALTKDDVREDGIKRTAESAKASLAETIKSLDNLIEDKTNGNH